MEIFLCPRRNVFIERMLGALFFIYISFLMSWQSKLSCWERVAMLMIDLPVDASLLKRASSRQAFSEAALFGC